MKNSRKLVSIILGLIALFCLGAVLGSVIPNVPIYACIAAGSVAVLVIGIWFFFGHKKEEFETEPEDDSEE